MHRKDFNWRGFQESCGGVFKFSGASSSLFNSQVVGKPAECGSLSVLCRRLIVLFSNSRAFPPYFRRCWPWCSTVPPLSPSTLFESSRASQHFRRTTSSLCHVPLVLLMYSSLHVRRREVGIIPLNVVVPTAGPVSDRQNIAPIFAPPDCRTTLSRLNFVTLDSNVWSVVRIG